MVLGFQPAAFLLVIRFSFFWVGALLSGSNLLRLRCQDFRQRLEVPLTTRRPLVFLGGVSSTVWLESPSSTSSRLPPAAGSAADDSETFAMTWAVLLLIAVVGAMVGASSRLFLGGIVKNWSRNA